MVHLLVLLAAFCLKGVAEDDFSIAKNYIRTDFTVDDGLPSSVVNAIAQTDNGILWVATDTGLATFDGRNFRAVHLNGSRTPTQGAVNSLVKATNGDLWIGSNTGAVRVAASSLNDAATAQFHFYPLGKDGSDEVQVVTQAKDGSVWAGTNHGLYRYRQDRFEVVLTSVSIFRVNEDPAGNLLLGTGQGFQELRNGTLIAHSGEGARFGLHDNQIFNVAEGSDGIRWYSTQAGVRRISSSGMPALQPKNIANTAAFRTQVDQEGNVWVSTGVGLYKVAAGTLFTPAPGVTARSFFSDEDGTLWIGTNGQGLVRLRPRSVSVFGQKEGLPNDNTETVLETSDKRLWVGNNCGLSVFDGKRFRSYREQDGLINSCVWSLAEDRGQNLWIGTYGGGLFRFKDERFTQFLPDRGLVSKVVTQVIVAKDDTLWIATPDGLSHMVQGKFHNYTTADGLASDHILSVFQDHSGVMWVATQGGVLKLVGTRFVSVGPGRPSADSAATRFAEDAEGNLYTTNSPSGLSKIQNERFITIEDKLPLKEMLEIPPGVLWFSGRSGLVRLTSKELDRFVADRSSPLAFSLIDRNDGLPSTQSSVGSPNIAVTSDHKLWMTTVRGLAMVNLDTWGRPARKAKVFVESVLLDGRRASARGDGIELSPGTNHVEFHIAAVDLAASDKIRIQYRLSDVDAGWIDADDTRAAVYANIPPGRHVLKIRATDSAGAWDYEGISYVVTQRPFLYQRRWFQVACVLILAFLLVVGYLVRIRAIMRQTYALLEQRLIERERIARDLHDTFFQGIQGLLLRFNLGAKMLEPGHPARQVLDDALNRSDKVMEEGRDLVLDLRTAIRPRSDLGDKLSGVAQEWMHVKPIPYKLVVGGRSRPLQQTVFEEVFGLLREAINNAYQHSGASLITITLSFSAKEFRASVVDDGKGIDQDVLGRGSREGHFGLPGMEERAKKVRGRLKITSGKNSGTRVDVRIVARIAHDQKARD